MIAGFEQLVEDDVPLDDVAAAVSVVDVYTRCEGARTIKGKHERQSNSGACAGADGRRWSDHV